MASVRLAQELASPWQIIQRTAIGITQMGKPRTLEFDMLKFKDNRQ